VNGVLVCDKPADVTSLDPFATGVLLVLLGRATRLQRYLLPLPKTYVATARLGWRSSTGDRDGELEQTGVVPGELSLPVGRVSQMVPMTSAVKVGGERLYKRAHRGEESADRPVREVEVYRAELLESSDEWAVFEIECGSGTYVRTLIETLGDAYCEDLRRTAVGSITIESAGRLLSPLEALSFLPRVEIGDADAEALGFGRPVPCETGLPEGDPVALVNADNLIAVARRSGEDLRPEVVMEARG
jgi:tRNA pseudouridine55 synthase